MHRDQLTMQHISVYLYSNKVNAYTNAFSGWTETRYRRVYNHNLKVYRGVDNRIDFQVRNADEKVQSISGSIVVFSLSNKETGELILQKDCAVQSTQTGKVYVNLLETDMRNIESGLYIYCLHSEVRTPIDNDNYTVASKKPLYIDSQYAVNATIEIYGDVFGEPSDSVEVKAFREDIDYDDLNNESTFTSSIIEANPQVSTPQSFHTFQFNLTEFYGTITIEASQSEGANPEIWSAVAKIESANDNILYKNIIGKYNWFRIKYVPRKTENLALFTIRQNTYSLLYTVTIETGGKGYQAGDIIIVKGNKLGGEQTTNDLTITVLSVDSEGAITNIEWQGLSYNGVQEFSYRDPIAGEGSVDSILYR